MLDVVDMFREQDTRDELGLAPVRDALSDLFFPGTVVPQTRARYFLFVPWIYQRLEGDGVRSEEIERLARQREGKLIEVLKRLPDKGVIGRQSGAEILRLPSSTYWPGLARWGIFRWACSREEYHAAFSALHERRRRRQVTDDKEVIDGRADETWDLLPDAPKRFPEGVDFRLTHEEASYLQSRIESSIPRSLLAWLVSHARADDRLRELAYVWDLGRLDSAHPDLQGQLEHARCFSEVMHGAALLYNLLLARESRRTDAIEQYLHLLQQWAGAIQRREATLGSWQLDSLWSLVAAAGQRMPEGARAFVEAWVEWVRSTGWNPRSADAAGPSNLVREREIQLKTTQSRFQNPHLLARWGGDSGTGAMTYRWGIARGILADILEGLDGER